MGRVERFGETGLYFRVPDPAEEQIDRLDCGPGIPGSEEGEYFRNRAWTGAVDGRECECLELLTQDGDVVGYIAFQVVPKKHPSLRSRLVSDYLFLYHLCLERTYQGEVDTSGPEPSRWSDLTLRLVDHLAARLGCAGVYLNVRDDNGPARRLYVRHGFVEDGSYVRRDTTVSMVRMRKILT